MYWRVFTCVWLHKLPGTTLNTQANTRKNTCTRTHTYIFRICSHSCIYIC